MNELTQIDDYNYNLDLLIEQYKSRPKYKAFVSGQADQANDIETAMFEIRDNFWIDTALGVQLDVLGNIQKEDRNGITDDEVYRTRIKTKIIVNNGSGNLEIIITYLRDLVGANKVQIQQLGNLKLYIWTDYEIDEYIFSQLEKIVMSGVGLYTVSGSLDPFVTCEADGAGMVSEDMDGDGLTEAEMNDNGSDQTMGGQIQDVRQDL